MSEYVTIDEAHTWVDNPDFERGRLDAWTGEQVNVRVVAHVLPVSRRFLEEARSDAGAHLVYGEYVSEDAASIPSLESARSTCGALNRSEGAP